MPVGNQMDDDLRHVSLSVLTGLALGALLFISFFGCLFTATAAVNGPLAGAALGFILTTACIVAAALIADRTVRAAALRGPPPPPKACAQCGYSTTGLTTAICPECGATIPDERRSL